MKPNLHKIGMFFKKNWLTIILLIIIAFLLTSCGSVKKNKRTEIREEKKTEVVEKKESTEVAKTTESESQKTTEKIQNEKIQTETHSDRTVTADEVFIDKDGNLSAKGNVQVNESRKEKTSEESQSNETTSESEKSVTNELSKSDNSESSKSESSTKEKTTEKNKQTKSSIWIDLWWLWLLIAGAVIFFVYRKVKQRTTLL